ncbi:MAG: reverse transcriptase domain-containing protein, partial [Cetobacterium sp.]
MNNDESEDSGPDEVEAEEPVPVPVPAASPGMRTRGRARAEVASGIVQAPANSELNPKLILEMKKLDGYVLPNPEAQSIIERAREVSREAGTAPPDAVTMAINAITMIDKYDADIAEYVTDLAMASMETLDHSKIDPSKYKDIFENPKTFMEAWNHPDTFQREKWREAIEKEFAKMERNKVWRKFKRVDIPQGRRCVKHKWIFEWKRNGTARARLVACGYSQVAGIDFTQVFSPVANDVSFR